MRIAEQASEKLPRPGCGFDTIGNATIVAYDGGKPIVATDPWLDSAAYFGSWALASPVPPEQRRAVLDCPFVWFSHGHPDHLNPDNLELFKGRTILLPDHHGERIKRDLESMGHTIRVLPSREFVSLSPNVRALCIPDYYQDAILLLDVGGRLLLDLNDALDRGWGRFVRRQVARFEASFLLSLFGYGDADMINFRDDEGRLIPPKAARKLPVGRSMTVAAESLGVDYVIPFSSMHRYQREDSIWCEEFITRLEDYQNGFDSKTCELMPAFVRYDCERDLWCALEPPMAEPAVKPPEAFGDNWSEPLSVQDVRKIREYFGAISHLKTFLDFIGFRVGGSEHVIELAPSAFNRGITFEAPRGSLMTAIEYRIFDDMLIGNFMRTTLHGKWPQSKLYPDFIPYVARYADNANARSADELEAYRIEYRNRAPLEHFFHTIEQRSIDLFRARVTPGSPCFESGKRAYWQVKGWLR